MIHSFLMVGQSNMAGRGIKEEVEPISNPNLLVLRNGRWQKMYVPVNCDRKFSGVSLAESFADEYSKTHEGVMVGLIPCADGGTTSDQWQEGSLLFDHAIYQTRLASRTSTVAGILWHQGESDVTRELDGYEEKLDRIVKAFRKEDSLRDVPFLLGGLGIEFLKYYDEAFGEKGPLANEIIERVAAKNRLCGYVSAEGLAPKSDNLHFNSKSLREFGIRYFNEFSKLEDKNRVFEEKPREDGAVRSSMELL